MLSVQRWCDYNTLPLLREKQQKKLASPIFYLGVLLIPVNYGCMPLMVVVKWEILGIAIITIGRITLFNIISQYLVH